jgi:hypothetical protein
MNLNVDFFNLPVKGSFFTQFKLVHTGNFMVPSISGLQNLIQIPSGCGEQTMVNFAPDVYITKYMNITNQLTEDVKNNAISAIRSGAVTYTFNCVSSSLFLSIQG